MSKAERIEVLKCKWVGQPIQGDDLRWLVTLIRTEHPQADVLLTGATAIHVDDQFRYRLVRNGIVLPLNIGRLLGDGPRSYLSRACRFAVRTQIEQVRNSYPDVITCVVTGLSLPKDMCDVDHVEPWTFTRIVTAWLLEIQGGLQIRPNTELTLQLAQVTETPHKTYFQDVLSRFEYKLPEVDGCIVDTNAFKSDEIAEHFATFHQQRAQLRMISAVANRVMLRSNHED